MNNRSLCFRDSQIRSKPYTSYPPPPQPESAQPRLLPPSLHHQSAQPPPPPSLSDELIQQVLREELRAQCRQKRRTQELNSDPPPPLHHQPPLSEIHSDHLRSQVTASSSSSSSSPAQITKPNPTEHTSPSSLPSEHLPSISIPPPPGPIWHPPPPSPTPSATPTEPTTPSPLPFAPSAPPPVRETLNPQPRSFPSLLPCRETLTLTSPTSPSLSVASLFTETLSLSAPPPVRKDPSPSPNPSPTNSISDTTKFINHKNQQQQSQIHQQQEKNSEKKKSPGSISLQPSYTAPFEQSTTENKCSDEEMKGDVVARTQLMKADSISVLSRGEDIEDDEELLLLFEQIAVLEKQKERQLLPNSDVQVDKEGPTVEKIHLEQIWVPEKQAQIQTLILEQKLEDVLILIKYVDSPPTSDVSTIRGRIVFKKGRMIPYIMGLDRGRTRPPRARLKDRDPPLLFRLC